MLQVSQELRSGGEWEPVTWEFYKACYLIFM